MTLTPLGVAKNGGKELVKVAAKEGAEFVSENVAKVTAKTTAKEVAKTTGETLTETIAKTTAKTTAKEATEVVSQNLAKTTAKEVAEALGEKVAKDSAKDGTESVVKTATKTATKTEAKETSQTLTKSATEVKNGAKETGEVATKTTTETATTKSAKESNAGADISNAYAKNTEVFDIVKYGDKTPGLENHHGVLDVWATNNINGYKSRAYDSTTIALTKEQHAATNVIYREWLFDKTGKKVGGKVDWNDVSPKEIKQLSDDMFNAAKVPSYIQDKYYKEFNKFIYNLKDVKK